MQITKGKKPVCKGFTQIPLWPLWERQTVGTAQGRGPPGPRGEGTAGAQRAPGTRDSSA